MPPDSSISPDPQARPCATLALRPGWLASGLGVGARTGLHAELTAYSIVFWGHDALPAQDMVAWQQEKARLMEEMSLAGQKGAYGKLGALSSDLNRAFDDHIELSLRAGAGTHIRTEEVQALANGLAEEMSCRVLAWSVCRNHVHVVAELTEEKGVDELVCSWKALAPSMDWEKRVPHGSPESPGSRSKGGCPDFRTWGMTPLPLLMRKRTAPSPETASGTLPFCCMRRWTC